MLTEGIMEQIILAPIYLFKGVCVVGMVGLGCLCLYGICTDDPKTYERSKKMYRHIEI